MKKLLSIIALACLCSSGTALADQIYLGRLNCSIDLPIDWQVDSTQFGHLYFHNDLFPDAMIELIRYPINPTSLIENDQELEQAIIGLYKELGEIQIDGDSVQYTTYKGRADFELRYKPADDSDGQSIHYLKGIIIRNASGDQIFYLLRSKFNIRDEARMQADINGIINSMAFTDDLSERLYPDSNIMAYLLILLILALTAFFYSRNRRVQRSRNPLGLDSGSHWRCSSCGLVNHIDRTNCERCGNTRREVGSIDIGKKD